MFAGKIRSNATGAARLVYTLQRRASRWWHATRFIVPSRHNEASSPTYAWHTTVRRFIMVSGQAPYYYDMTARQFCTRKYFDRRMRSNYTCIFLRSKFVVIQCRFSTPTWSSTVFRWTDFVVWPRPHGKSRYNARRARFTYTRLWHDCTEPLVVQRRSACRIPRRSSKAPTFSCARIQYDSDQFGFGHVLITAEFLDRVPRRRAFPRSNPLRVCVQRPNHDHVHEPYECGAADLRINGVAATSMTSSNNTIYTFGFPAPYGNVHHVGHKPRITDLSANAFERTAAGAPTYSLGEIQSATVASQTPAAWRDLNSSRKSKSRSAKR